MYWFNPLAWIAARHVRTERERACDDLVLASGTRGSGLRRGAAGNRARDAQRAASPRVMTGATLAMAHRSQLEGRLMAILDPKVPRSGLSRLRTASAAVVSSRCALPPLASLQPWTVAAAAGTEQRRRTHSDIAPPEPQQPSADAVSTPTPRPRRPTPTPVSERRPRSADRAGASAISRRGRARRSGAAQRERRAGAVQRATRAIEQWSRARPERAAEHRCRRSPRRAQPARLGRRRAAAQEGKRRPIRGWSRR